MAFRKTLAQRLFHITKISSLNSTLTHSPIASHLIQEPLVPPDQAKTNFRKEFRSDSDSGSDWFFRRYLQKRAIVQSAVASPELRSLSLGDKLKEKLKGINISGDRLRLEGLNLPVKRSDSLDKISFEEVQKARKMLMQSQLEMLKTKLKSIPEGCITYSEFIQICSDGCSSTDQGSEFAKVLEQSGAVILHGNVVFLKPEQVTKAIDATMQGLIPLGIAHPNDPRIKELEEMEKEKIAIDEKADALVKTEIGAGLGFLLVQTAAFMRVTFWELSWDVMEPICFYLTTFYFLAGYTFFMITSREPSFEGFYRSRFIAKQKRLMKNKKFDIKRFYELRKACNPFSPEQHPSPPPPPNHSDRTMLGATLYH
ncbi:calcium uniporter protein 1, mitochondrial-like [Telopea speciosissima]|uniref:calcium uniporter protein 1, mitochondrial-like n=1 Tax=Telopea speciosissima TaxID=54955 RepID=UPI001CC63E8F|nr:calcium uniporter protein 1, mitochondrial-like [Telopea speciosissima]